MRGDAPPVCPDCTYPLTGLTEPRCPECGLQFDARLLTEANLARPRPAWERRPRVSFMVAVWRTLIDVTIRPGAFFGGIQQPDRLRRPVYWLLLIPAVSYFLGVACLIVGHRLGRATGLFAGLPQREYFWLVLDWTAWAVLWVSLLVLLPLTVMLLLADLLLWRDRGRYRLFFKGTMYTATVYLWIAFLICGTMIVHNLFRGKGSLAPFPWDEVSFWMKWLGAGATTWQYALLYHAVLGRRFAAWLPEDPTRRSALSLLVIGAWLIGVYLALFDDRTGLRFATAHWVGGMLH